MDAGKGCLSAKIFWAAALGAQKNFAPLPADMTAACFGAEAARPTAGGKNLVFAPLLREREGAEFFPGEARASGRTLLGSDSEYRTLKLRGPKWGPQRLFTKLF